LASLVVYAAFAGWQACLTRDLARGADAALTASKEQFAKDQRPFVWPAEIVPQNRGTRYDDHRFSRAGSDVRLHRSDRQHMGWPDRRNLHGGAESDVSSGNYDRLSDCGVSKNDVRNKTWKQDSLWAPAKEDQKTVLTLKKQD